MNPNQLLDSMWLKGPEFLWHPDFTPHAVDPLDLHEGDPEVRNIQVCSTCVNSDGRTDLIQCLEKISSWNLLIRVVARIRRLSSRNQFSSGVISADERSKATLIVIKLIQAEHYQKEIEVLQSKGEIHLSSSLARTSDVALQSVKG